jgi:ribose 5-phosphate isomerase B
MKVVLGSDHAGFLLKEELKERLDGLDYEVEDLGTYNSEPTDYPDIALVVGERVLGASGQALGVLVCGTGIGVSMAANKLRGIRAARCDDPYTARMARAHNDANVLCIGSRVIGAGVAEAVLRAFLETSFEGGRHARRVEKINALDK